MLANIWTGRDWREHLADLLRESDADIVIAAPYISQEGVEFTLSHISPRMKEAGTLTILTDLSPLAVCQGSIQPSAVRLLAEATSSSMIYHLPKLHAKVYVSGQKKAIVTSGNLTRGGLYGNYEFGVCTDDLDSVSSIRDGILAYTALGSPVSKPRLNKYCETARGIRSLYEQYDPRKNALVHPLFREAYKEAEDELCRIRLDKGAIHTIFEDAILFFLKRDGPLATHEIHARIEAAYPDLCDNSKDRVIDGYRFGKLWKHAVRTAQQHLKKREVILLIEGRWRLKQE